MKLDLGSGFTPYQPESGEWIHIDANRNAPLVDLIMDAFGPLPFDDDAMESVRAVDLLEHVPYTRTDAVVTEWARVLKPGGKLFVQVPSAARIMQWYVADDPRLKIQEGGKPCTALYGAQWRLFGGLDDGKYVEEGGDWRLNLHAAMFDADSLRALLEHAGLVVESLEENGHPNLLCWARKAKR